MSNIAIFDPATFSVERVSKAGKVTARGALGVIMSGNASERAALAKSAVQAMISNHNYRALLREVSRVFPLSALKKAPNVTKQGDDWAFLEERTFDGAKALVITPVDLSNPNKSIAMQYARAIVATVDENKAKGEKLMVLRLLRDMVQAEVERLEAEATA